MTNEEKLLELWEDKQVMRTRLTELGVPCPRWAPVPDVASLESFLHDVGGTAVVKTVRGGYDGKGVRVVHAATEVSDWLEAFHDGAGVALIVEEKVPFTRELAVLVARSPSGEVRAWPVVESVQERGVCSEVIAPAPDLDPATAETRVGQRMATVYVVTSVDPGRSWTGRLSERGERLSGPLSVTYAAHPAPEGGPDACRLHCRMVVPGRTRAQRARATALAWGDLVMIRKQLHQLAALAARDAAAEA